jgi:hypothetical protein
VRCCPAEHQLLQLVVNSPISRNRNNLSNVGQSHIAESRDVASDSVLVALPLNSLKTGKHGSCSGIKGSAVFMPSLLYCLCLS